MSGPRRRRPPTAAAAHEPAAVDPWAESGLAELGLTAGDLVRFRRHDGERWRLAVVERRERDGSVGLRDGDGAARSIPIGQIEVRSTGPRGGVRWDPLDVQAVTPEQRRLF
jgi:hypothetical protein